MKDISDNSESESQSLALTDSERKELDSRLALHERNPVEGISWDELKERLRGQ
jgi:putative addiction module component (TIGR02574 family)